MSAADVTNTARVRAAEALRRHAPELADVDVTHLGGGLDHAAFVAGSLVLRVADGRSVQREAGLLAFVAPRLPIPVPRPRFSDDSGVLGYPKLLGRPLLGAEPPPGSAAALGRFLRDLHAIAPAAVAEFVDADDAEPAAWLTDLREPADLVGVVRSSVPPPSPRRVLAHTDLGAEHILSDGTTMTGILDWTDAAVTDPAVDFGRIYRDFGPVFLDQTLHAYGGLDGAEPRIEYYARCAALEDFAYGQRTGREEYAAAAERSFSWLFPDQKGQS
jgi:aminoglycoside phosphotransferase (APT) family kinase protein